MEEHVCMAAQAGSICCSDCQGVIDEYIDCAFGSLRASVCPDISNTCDDLITVAATGAAVSKSAGTRNGPSMIPLVLTISAAVLQVIKLLLGFGQYGTH